MNVDIILFYLEE